MPKYLYKCEKCSETIEIYHSMNDTKEDCTVCDSTQTLKKIPNKITYSNITEKSKTVGSVVRQSIEEFQNDLSEQKQKLRSEFYGTDD